MTLPCVAVICVLPALSPVARPVAGPIVATEEFEDAQVTLVVMFLLLLSLYVPVAVNCCVWDVPMEEFAGVIEMDCRVTGGGLTVSMAPLLVAEPAEFETATTNVEPESCKVVAGVV